MARGLCAPSHEGPWLLGVLCASEMRDYQVSRFRFELDFSAGSSGFFVRRPPGTFAPGFILPRAFRLLRSTAACDLLPVPRKIFRLPIDREAPPLGSSSLIAASAGGVHHPAGNPNPAVKFRPRRFSRPRRLAPPPAFAGLFHPAATSRVCPPGVCPSPRSRTGFPRPSHALLPLNVAACDQRPRLRLQGLAPRGECGVCRGCLDPDRSAPLLGFSSSGFSPRAPWERLHAPFARDLHCDEPTAAGPRRFTGARVGFPVSRPPTRSRFLA